MRVALLPGDGVGPEVIAQARRVVDALGCGVAWTELPWGSAYWHAHGRMMPDDAIETLASHDAILLGAVGDPSVPDHEALWGLILKIRQGLDLWCNERPARLLSGIPCPLAGRGPADIDMVFVRENTEGEYSGVGGRVHRSFEHEVAIETTVFTRRGCERIVRRAFELATGRKGVLTNATKSNASRHGFPFWDQVLTQVGAAFPEVRVEHVLVDALAARIVRDPGSIDVVVASNLFGDILTDLAAALQGGLGMAASANIAPGGDAPGLFEPVHGSAPDIAGRGIANPAGAIWSTALMLEHLGLPPESRRVMAALESTCLNASTRTRDVGGSATTIEAGDAVIAALGGDAADLLATTAEDADPVTPLAVVTGAASGIGRATALRLLREGVAVVAVDIDEPGLTTAAGAGARPLVADLGTEEGCAAVVEAGAGGDYLVNAAAIIRLQPLLEVTRQDWRDLFRINAESVFFLCQQLGPQLRPGGAIVNLSSVSAKLTSTLETAVYAATKTAILAVTRSFAYALAERNVRVNAICPGITDTPMQEAVLRDLARLRDATYDELERARTASVPMRRTCSPDDVAAMIWRLLSDDASYMTGEALNFSGGLAMW